MTSSLAELGYPALLAGALIGVTFNRPSWLRSQATFLRFHLATLIYVGIYLAALLIAFIVCRDALQLEDRVAAWVAFAATAVLRFGPGVDDGIRRWIFRLSDMPGEARHRVDELIKADLHASEKVKSQAAAMMQAAGIPEDCDWIPRAQPMLDQLRRATWLFVQLRNWDDELRQGRVARTRALNSRFATGAPEAAGDVRGKSRKVRRNAFLVEAENDMFRMRQRFDAILFRIARMLRSVELLGEVKHAYSKQAPDRNDIDEPLRRMIDGMISDCSESITRLHSDLCMLATRGIFATKWTRVGRARAFERLGFSGQEHERTDIYLVMALAAGFLFLSMWLYFMNHDPTLREGEDLNRLQLVLVIVLVQMSAIAITIHAKLHFGFANGGLHQRTPWRYIAALGAFAGVVALLINAIAGAAYLGGLDGARDRVGNFLPWLPVGVTTAMLLAWLVQDYRWRRITSPNIRRICDAALFGVAWFLAGLFAFAMLGRITSAGLMVCFALGATLGALIPERARYRPDSIAERDMNIPEWLDHQPRGA